MLLSLSDPTHLLFEFLKQNLLIAPLVQLLAAIIAFIAVIWTQNKMRERSERDIQARLNQMKEQQAHDNASKFHEIQLKKTEDMLELAYLTQIKHMDFYKYLFSTTDTQQDIYLKASSLLTDASSTLAKLDALACIYLGNDDLCSEWENDTRQLFQYMSDTLHKKYDSNEFKSQISLLLLAPLRDLIQELRLHIKNAVISKNTGRFYKVQP